MIQYIYKNVNNEGCFSGIDFYIVKFLYERNDRYEEV